MDFEVTIYLIYSAFIKYLRNKKTHAIYQLFFGFKRANDSVMGAALLNSVTECVINMKLVILTKM